ncbi:MAG: isochorismatase family protein [Nitriliruptorales bacterium]|nr:isochorismatase family protein [Nitriliruptorales bacterium]
MTNPYGVDEIRPAVVTIDMHRGHLDPDVATLPLPADVSARVVDANLSLLGRARMAGIPVLHVITSYRDTEESSSNAFWRAIADTNATRSNVLRHNLDHMPGVQPMPGMFVEGDRVVDTKKRYDCFLHTDLEFTLRRLGVNTLLITGVNTNSCVLTTTIAASVRDYACIVVEDCVDTVDGPEYHDAALKCIRRAFGWAMPADEALREIGAAQTVAG